MFVQLGVYHCIFGVYLYILHKMLYVCADRCILLCIWSIFVYLVYICIFGVYLYFWYIFVYFA